MSNTIKIAIELEGKQAIREVTALNNKLKNTGKVGTEGINKLNGSLGSFLGNLGAIAAFKAFDTLKQSIRESFTTFTDFESGLIAVAKTTNLTASEMKGLEKGIVKLASKLPVPTKELLSIAEAAGQLGVVGQKNILKFSETIAKLGRVSDLSGNDAATVLTRILNVTREGADTIDVFGSVIVSLGNNFAATESEIARMANEVARATAQFGVTSAEAASLGTVMRSFGVRAEEAGSTTGKAFRAIKLAIDTGGESLKQLSKVTGLTGEQLRVQFGESAIGVFKKFLEGTNRMAKSGATVSTELAKMGLTGERVLKVLPVLSQNTGELDRALGLANKEIENATALNTEFSKTLESTDSKIKLLSNEVEKVQRAIGEKLAKALTTVQPILIDFLKGLTENTESTFIRHTNDAQKLGKELEILRNKLTTINADGKVSFFEADPKEIAANITLIETKLQGMNDALNSDKITNAKAQLKDLENQLATLGAPSANGNIDLFSGILPDDNSLDAKKVALIEKISNIKKEIALTTGQVLKDEQAAQDQASIEDALITEQAKFDALTELKASHAASDKEVKAAEKELEVIRGNAEVERLVGLLGRKKAALELHRISQIKDADKRAKELKKINDRARLNEKKGILEFRKFEDSTNKQKEQSMATTLNNISSLSGSSNKTLFAIGKAAALAQHAIAVPKAISTALSSAPPPFNFALAALVGTAMVAQGVKIASAKPPSFASGGIVGGSSFTGDKVAANVNSGEMIFNRRQQENLFNAVDTNNIGGNNSGGDIIINGDVLGDDASIDKLIDGINDGIEFRNKKILGAA